MVKQIYTGLIVDDQHPNNGKMFTHYDEFMTYYIAPPIRGLIGSPDRPIEQPVIDKKYLRLVDGLRGEVIVDFWVPTDKNASWALEKLVKFYADNAWRNNH
jgi:hypothetical protein